MHTHRHAAHAKLRHGDTCNTIQSRMQTRHETTRSTHTDLLRDRHTPRTQEDPDHRTQPATRTLQKTHAGHTQCEHTDAGRGADKHTETQTPPTSHALDRDMPTDVGTGRVHRTSPGQAGPCSCCSGWREVEGLRSRAHTRGLVHGFPSGWPLRPRAHFPAPRPPGTPAGPPGLSHLSRNPESFPGLPREMGAFLPNGNHCSIRGRDLV